MLERESHVSHTGMLPNCGMSGGDMVEGETRVSHTGMLPNCGMSGSDMVERETHVSHRGTLPVTFSCKDVLRDSGLESNSEKCVDTSGVGYLESEEETQLTESALLLIREREEMKRGQEGNVAATLRNNRVESAFLENRARRIGETADEHVRPTEMKSKVKGFRLETPHGLFQPTPLLKTPHTMMQPDVETLVTEDNCHADATRGIISKFPSNEVLFMTQPKLQFNNSATTQPNVQLETKVASQELNILPLALTCKSYVKDKRQAEEYIANTPASVGDRLELEKQSQTCLPALVSSDIIRETQNEEINVEYGGVYSKNQTELPTSPAFRVPRDREDSHFKSWWKVKHSSHSQHSSKSTSPATVSKVTKEIQVQYTWTSSVLTQEEERVSDTRDSSAQTDTFPAIQGDAVKYAHLIQAVVQLQDDVAARKTIPKKTLHDVLRSLSPTPPSSTFLPTFLLSQKKGFEFPFSPPWLKSLSPTNKLFSTPKRSVAPRVKITENVHQKNQEYMRMIKSMYPKQAKHDISSGNTQLATSPVLMCKSTRVVFRSAPAPRFQTQQTLSDAPPPKKPRQEEDAAGVPAHTVAYSMRCREVPQRMEQSLETCLKFLQEQILSDVVVAAEHWKGSPLEYTTGIIRDAADSDAVGLSRSVRALVQHMFQCFLTTAERNALECFVDIMFEFCQSGRICVSLIQQIISHLRQVQEGRKELDQDLSLPRLTIEDDKIFYLTYLLHRLLKELIEQVETKQHDVATTGYKTNVLKTWQKHWRSDETEGRESGAEQTMDTVFDWVDLLDSAACAVPGSILSSMLLECTACARTLLHLLSMSRTL